MDEKQIQEALTKGTEKALHQKQALWHTLQQKIEREKQNKMARKAQKRKRGLAVAAVAAVVTAALVLTPAGAVLADRIMRLFAPQQEVITEVEGEQENQTVTLEGNTAQKMGYVIYIDEERYTMESADGADVIKALNHPEGYPPVEMAISQQTEQDARDAYAQLLKQARDSYDHVESRGEISDPVDGMYILAYNEGGGEAAMEWIFVVDNTQNGCFVIRCRLFVEAEEGHGARFLSMLRTFEVVESDQVQTP